MTIKRVKAAAEARGAYFNGEKHNNGATCYQMFSPSGYGFLQADTLSGLYKLLQDYPIVRK